MRVNRFLMPILALVGLFGTVLVAQATGNFATNGRAGTDLTRLTPADLKGWMTLQDVMNGLNISQNDLYAAGNIPSNILPTTALNKLEAQVSGFSVTSLRDTLTAKLGAPSSASTPPTSSDATSPSAAPVTPVTAPATASAVTHATPTPLPAGQVLPANQIKGSMTLRSASQQCAVPLDQVIAGLKLPAETNPDALIKDLVGQGKISEVTAVQKVVAELQSK
jgi:hypothetical protein